MKKKQKICGGLFDFDTLLIRIKELEELVNDANLWNDKDNAEKIVKELTESKKKIEGITNLKTNIKNNLEILSDDLEILELIEKELEHIEKELTILELDLLLDGPYDKEDCILDIHSGAGGTEACDWAAMLLRMYLRYAEANNYKVETLGYQEGDETGYKSISVQIKGTNAYGYLKGEQGIHRLVRLSPFDSNNRRHTSFASVEITPIFNQKIELDIKDTDLKIDTYRSTGAGGQSVNTTDSAVRITHLPTKTVVTCQNERSQLQNKDKAMEVLKNKLYQLEIKTKENQINNIKGTQNDINFGSQIRSYVLHPYSMVKDHRTNSETSNVNAVLDGKIDMFIESYLKECRK